MQHKISSQIRAINKVLLMCLFILFQNVVGAPAIADSLNEDSEDLLFELFPPVGDLPKWQERYTIGSMTTQAPLRVSGINTQMQIGFGGRFDQVVTDARFRVNYQISPAIIDVVTQVRVLLNNEVTGVIPLRAENAGSKQSAVIDLDPRLFSTYNELKFELLSEVNQGQCTSASPSAWFEVLRDSELMLEYQQLKVANELAYFPEPWFDKNDFGFTQLAFILPELKNTAFLEATSILTSYFGVQADWREMRIDTMDYQFDRPSTSTDWRTRWPKRHSILMMTNEDKPWALRNIPAASATQLRVMDNPAYPTYKLLVLHAPTAQDLVRAAATIAVSSKGMSGDQIEVQPRELEPRLAYQAPRWIPIDRPVRFSELVDHPSELERSAANRTPVQIELRLPPDLFTWQKYGIPIDLRFRYTPPIVRDESRVLVNVNNEFVKGFTMTEAGVENPEERLRIPIIDGGLFSEENVQIPSFKLGAINQLQFEFSFGSISDSCRVMPLQNARGAVDSNSMIDLRGYEHYVAMPDMHLFAKTGYPFTRYDDLSNTKIVVPKEMNSDILQTLLIVTSKLSSASGYPAVKLDIVTIDEVTTDMTYDFLLIGSTVLQEWFARFGQAELKIQVAGHGIAGQSNLLFDPELALRNNGPSAAVVGFQSPFYEQGSVVAITATSDGYLRRVREAFNDSSQTDKFTGFLSILTPANVDSYDTIQPYYIGTLSWWKRFTYHLSQYPMLVTLMALLAVLILTLLIVRVMQGKAKQRKASS
ncbi:hypothetical protein C9927_00035 [Pseudidiomarina aestuarii]|uniref:Cyclic di-GMP-binding protein n=1 Tax=Pseudidiomarina aestuarii TaxID=624146 RepID=A0A2T4D9G2_9GAMM|nr:hypothetical protein C9928_00370 [Pseudidiomarina aestuarii]PTB90471.1 hypothetical protein C9927_00035 [Pseudidiomarina aestuarii]